MSVAVKPCSSVCDPALPLQYGSDFYYRAHPEELKKFYAAVDEFHAAYDTLTEFESLNGLAAQMVPGACVVLGMWVRVQSSSLRFTRFAKKGLSSLRA